MARMTWAAPPDHLQPTQDHPQTAPDRLQAAAAAVPGDYDWPRLQRAWEERKQSLPQVLAQVSFAFAFSRLACLNAPVTMPPFHPYPPLLQSQVLRSHMGRVHLSKSGMMMV